MSSEDRTLLHVAASEGDLTKVKEILKDPKTELDAIDELGWTPLMIACSAGNIEIVKELIGSGADINRPNINGQTVLHYAASKSHFEICELLLNSKANVNSQDKYGSTPLHRAASKGNTKIVNLLLSSPHIQVNIQDNFGNTPLHCACEEERLAECKALIESGGDLEILNKEKQTPLDLCKRYQVRKKIASGEFDL